MMLHRAARLAGALIVLAVVASGSRLRTEAAQPGGQAALPSPEQFFGYQMGADRKLANWDKLLAYYQSELKRRRDELVTKWPPERSPAAQVFVQYIDDMLKSMQETGCVACLRASLYGTLLRISNPFIRSPPPARLYGT